MAAAAQAAQERPCLPHREAGPFLCLHRMESAARRVPLRPVQRQSHGKHMVARRVPVRPVLRQSHGKHITVRHVPVRPFLRQSHGKRRPPRSPAACSEKSHGKCRPPRFRAACSASIVWKVHGRAPHTRAACSAPIPWEAHGRPAAFPCGLFCANRRGCAWHAEWSQLPWAKYVYGFPFQISCNLRGKTI